jgi:hypothetical protein
LVKKLLQRNPSSRLGSGSTETKNGFEALKSHAFFKGVKWADIHLQEPPFFAMRTAPAESNLADIFGSFEDFHNEQSALQRPALGKQRASPFSRFSRFQGFEGESSDEQEKKSNPYLDDVHGGEAPEKGSHAGKEPM